MHGLLALYVDTIAKGRSCVISDNLLNTASHPDIQREVAKPY